MIWNGMPIGQERLYSMLRHTPCLGGCSTCGGIYQLPQLFTEAFGSERALEHRLIRLPLKQLRDLVGWERFYDFLGCLSLPVWARLAWRLTDRFPGPIRVELGSTERWSRDAPMLVRDRMVAVRRQRIASEPRPTPPRRLPPWTRALYDELTEAWDQAQEWRARREAESAERQERERQELEAWRAATPNWRQIEAARLEEWRRPERERQARVRAQQALEARHRAARRVRDSIGLKKPIERNDIRRVTALLNRGADPHYQFVNGDTAIEYAARLRRADLLALLRERADS